MLMKFLFVATILLIGFLKSSGSVKQIESNYRFKSLMEETKVIMQKLSIKIRSNIKSDNELKIIIDDSIPFFNTKFGSLNPKSGVMADSNDFSTRYYLQPVIRINRKMDSVITLRKDTNLIAYLKAVSAIVHELTHYMQATWDNGVYFNLNTMADLDKYITQPLEKEAHAVQSYYFLEYFKPVELTEITNDPTNQQERLINAFYRHVYPNRKLPF